MRLNEVMSYTDGIFKRLSELDGFTLWTEDQALKLDLEYLMNHSGQKTISPLVRSMLAEDKTLSEEALNKLAEVVYMINGSNWKYQFKYIEVEYNPIHNYSMDELETPDLTTKSESKAKSKQTTTETGDDTQKTYGFNSESPVNAGKNDSATKTITEGAMDDNQAINETTQTGTRKLHREGNIGVTTSSQMLEGDAKFWDNWNLWNKVMAAIDKILVLDIY